MADSGMPWFKLYRDVGSSPKLFELEDRVGPAALAHLVKWWCGVAAHRPDGVLTGIADTVLERWADWRGARGELASALRETGWIEGDQVHGWGERQGGVLAKVERDREHAAARRAESRDGRTTVARRSRERGEERRGEKIQKERECNSARRRHPSPRPSPHTHPGLKEFHLPIRHGSIGQTRRPGPRSRSRGAPGASWGSPRPR
jgi:hypothetical protein